jgi:hypothetical protein
MPGAVTLLTALGLMAFGVMLIFYRGGADDPYRNRKFGLGKGVSVRLIFAAVALLMGGVQLYLWLGGRL